MIIIGSKFKLPLFGHIAFGYVDRGTNVVQVRPITACVLNCIFCSTDAGPKSKRENEFLVEPGYMLQWFNEIVKVKGKGIEALIDTIGDPLLYPYLEELIEGLREFKEVETIAIETHGPLLSEQRILKLEEAGLDRINLSIDAIDEDLAKKLSGCPWFSVSRVIELAKFILECTSIDLTLCPVWVPGYNDGEIERLIELALDIGAGKKWAPIVIQKLERHKRGRWPKNARLMSWKEFWGRIEKLEEKFGIDLRGGGKFRIEKRERIPIVFRRGETLKARIVCKGLWPSECIGVARNRVIAVYGAKRIGMTKIKIIKVKDGIYVAKKV